MGGVFPPGTIKPTPQPVFPTIEIPPFPPSSPYKPPEGGGICEALLNVCLKVAYACSPLNRPVSTGYYAAYFGCKAATLPHDPPPPPLSP